MNMIIQMDLIEKINDSGGVLSAVLALATIALWLKYHAAQKALADLNQVVRDTGKEDMKIIDKLTHTIEKSTENDGLILKAVNETLTILKDRKHE